MSWRVKRMSVADWGSFQDEFEQLFDAMKADPEMALFSQREPGDDHVRLFITNQNADLVERLSPNGWEDSDKPTGKGIALLVGNGDPAGKFSIELGLQ